MKEGPLLGPQWPLHPRLGAFHFSSLLLAPGAAQVLKAEVSPSPSWKHSSDGASPSVIPIPTLTPRLGAVPLTVLPISVCALEAIPSTFSPGTFLHQ